MPIRRDCRASRRWFGCARLRTVLLRRTISSSFSRVKAPVRGLSPVLTTTPSLTHCQNCVCVVQNCLRSRQTTSAVFFLFFLLAFFGPISFPYRKMIRAHYDAGVECRHLFKETKMSGHAIAPNCGEASKAEESVRVFKGH